MKLRCILITFMLALILNTNFIESVDSSNIKTDLTKTTNTKSETNEKKQFSESNEPQSIVSYEAHSHVNPPNGRYSRFNLYTQGLIQGEAKDELLTSGPVYWEGWGKYFHYDEQQKSTAEAKNFFVNNEYYHQKVLRSDYLKKDRKGYLNIPTKFHFYFSINENNVRVLSSRNRKLLKVVDTMHIDLIHPIALDDLETGGVKDLGEFDEGNCIQVLTSEPFYGPNPAFKVHNTEGGMQNDWVFCLDTINEKEILMKTLRKIKTLKQKARGDFFVLDTRKPSISKYLKPKATPNIERYTGQGANKDKDGYWVLLQDWSQCTLKCGGGVQHQQWLCQPPLPGGMPCQGSSIRKRPCNLQACPDVLIAVRKKTADIEVVKKPIIKSLPWSSRLQRYIQCEVKESDILYIKTDVPNQIGKEIKYPGRLVMTNRTLSMYEDDSFKHSIFTFNLQDTTLASYEKDSCCFFALSMDKKFRICGFVDVCGTKADPKFVKEWSRDFNLFQQKCYVDLPKKNWKKDLRAEDEDSGKIEVEQEKTLAREFLIKRKLKEKEDVELEKKITETQEVALRAIRKELKLERLIKTEEKLKVKERLKNLLNLKAKEEKKQECLERALKAREEESMKGRDNVMAEKEIAKIKEDAKKEVEKERAALRVKLNEYKKKSGRRQMQIEHDINLIRSKMAANLLLANKNGDMIICKNSLPDPELISKYCNANFVDNYKKNQDCKDMENFCDLCCSNEFGNMYLNKRDECFNLCDESIRQETGGDWIWTKEGFNGSK